VSAATELYGYKLLKVDVDENLECEAVLEEVKEERLLELSDILWPNPLLLFSNGDSLSGVRVVNIPLG
jgi:hypothetical protein